MDRLAKEYEPSHKFKLVSVAWGGWKTSQLPRVAKQAGTTTPVSSDPENWYDRLGVDAFPTKFLIRNGKILVRARGGGAGAYPRWKAAIEREMNAPPAPESP